MSFFGKVGQIQNTFGSVETVTLTQNTPVLANPTTTLDPLSDGWSMPANGELQNDTGLDLICMVCGCFTFNMSSGSASIEVSIGVSDGTYTYPDETKQKRSGTNTTQRLASVGGVITVNDGEKIGIFQENKTNNNNSNILAYNLFVVPFALATGAPTTMPSWYGSFGSAANKVAYTQGIGTANTWTVMGQTLTLSSDSVNVSNPTQSRLQNDTGAQRIMMLEHTFSVNSASGSFPGEFKFRKYDGSIGDFSNEMPQRRGSMNTSERSAYVAQLVELGDGESAQPYIKNNSNTTYFDYEGNTFTMTAVG